MNDPRAGLGPRHHEDPGRYDDGVADPGHDCPKQAFLDDPITEAYGVGSEMVGLIPCPVCDAEQAGQ
jgi:hypothetical protein